MYRSGRNDQPPDYLSLLRDPMNPNEKASEDIVGVAEVQVPSNILYDASIQRLIKIIDGLEMRKVDLEHLNYVRRNQKTFALWNGKLFRQTKASPRLVAPMKEIKKILRTFYDELGHWNLQKTYQLITERDVVAQYP